METPKKTPNCPESVNDLIGMRCGKIKHGKNASQKHRWVVAPRNSDCTVFQRLATTSRAVLATRLLAAESQLAVCHPSEKPRTRRREQAKE